MKIYIIICIHIKVYMKLTSRCVFDKIEGFELAEGHQQFSDLIFVQIIGQTSNEHFVWRILYNCRYNTRNH